MHASYAILLVLAAATLVTATPTTPPKKVVNTGTDRLPISRDDDHTKQSGPNDHLSEARKKMQRAIAKIAAGEGRSHQVGLTRTPSKNSVRSDSKSPNGSFFNSQKYSFSRQSGRRNSVDSTHSQDSRKSDSDFDPYHSKYQRHYRTSDDDENGSDESDDDRRKYHWFGSGI